MHRFIVIILGLLMSVLCGFAAESASVDFDGERYPFILVTPADSSDTVPTFSDDEFYKMSASVIFKVNKTDIRQDDPFLMLYRTEIIPMINAKELQLRKIFVRGAASPEGPYAGNRRLGKGRTEALITEIRKGLKDQYDDVDFEFSSITEDYGYLCILMEEKGDKDAAYVRNLCEKAKWDELTIKKRLMAARSGSLWKRLLREYFPQLRAARIVLWFSECDRDHALAFIKELEGPRPSALNPSQLALAPYNPPAPVFEPLRHLIAVRTNLVHDLFYMPQIGWTPSPNLQFEYYPLDGHWTANLGATWGTRRIWDSQQFWQVRDFQLEARRYFRGGGEFTGLYLGAFAHGDVYGIGLNGDKGWQGEGGGLGASLGYVLPLNRKGNFRLEFMLGAGLFLSRFDPYVYGNPVTGDIDGDYYYNYLGSATDFKRRNYRLSWVGPTNAGIQLTYDIIYRKRNY